MSLGFEFVLLSLLDGFVRRMRFRSGSIKDLGQSESCGEEERDGMVLSSYAMVPVARDEISGLTR